MSEALRHVHFVAIGGTGMGSLAGLLHARGLRVTGSDEKLYPPMSTLLEQWGISVIQGFRAENVLEHPPDLVVIGNAVRANNPEARAAIDEGLAYRSFPDALYELAIAGKHSVVVSGTHGKTTTTSLVAALLHGTGRDPSLLVGGHSMDFDGSFREGQGEHFVVEGDEYDTAFFDKTPKFLHYHADTLVITSSDSPRRHLSRSRHVSIAFRAVVARLPRTYAGRGNRPRCVRNVIAPSPCRWSLRARDRGAGSLATRVDWPTPWHALRSPSRRFTARCGSAFVRQRENALAALATVDALGVPLEEAAAALAGFRGVKRRQEVRGEERGILVIDDFAHHPTAVRATLDALRAGNPGRRLVAVFEPRTNTSRRRVFQRDYAEAFDGAGQVVIAVVPDTPIYSITGEVTERFSAQELAGDLRTRGIPADALEGVPAIVERLARDCRPGDVVIAMSNGEFGGLWQHLLEALRGGRGA